MKLVPGTDVAASSDPHEAPVGEDEPWVRCAACRGRIAPERARTAVDGAHEHTFLNPSGLRFVVGCFAAAPGTVPEGERSSVWTWFPGHDWQVALCRTCRAHVGWSFHAPSGASFWGLVLDRLLGERSGG